MDRLHRPKKAELLLWLCSAAILCTAASWPGTLDRSYKGEGPGVTAEPEPVVVTAKALVIRDERVLELPEYAVLIVEPGKRLAAYSAFAVVTDDARSLSLSLEARRVASQEDRAPGLSEARQSGSFALMEAALTGYAPEPDLSQAEPLFAGEAGLLCDGADGLERLGAGDALAMDAGTLRDLLGSDGEETPDLRLITGLRWYCAALTSLSLETGETVTLRLDGEEFTARVERSGEGVLLLSGTEGMDRMADIRKAQAEIEVP